MSTPRPRLGVLTIFHLLPFAVLGVVAGNVVAALLGGGLMRHYVASWLGAATGVLGFVGAVLVGRVIARK